MIPLARPDISELEIQAVSDVLRTPYLSLGPKIPEFEARMQEYTNVKHAVAMSSGTSVLHTMIRGLGIQQGDYVLTTPFSFISTSNVVLCEQATPLFVDIDEATYNLLPEQVEAAYLKLPANIKRRVKAILYVDVFGNPADGVGFEEIGRKYGLYILEDSAEALGSVHLGRKCGSFGDAGVFAFYPNKQITTGEGGMLLTNRDELAAIARSLRNQGRDEGAGWLQHARLGYNYRMSDINAVLGIAQMTRIKQLLSKRTAVKNWYDDNLLGLFRQGKLFSQQIFNDAIISPFVYVVRLGDGYTQKVRDEILTKLRAKDIQCSNYFTPIHLQPHYQKLGWKNGDLPITEKISERTIALPFFNNLSKENVTFVCEALESIIREY